MVAHLPSGAGLGQVWYGCSPALRGYVGAVWYGCLPALRGWIEAVRYGCSPALRGGVGAILVWLIAPRGWLLGVNLARYVMLALTGWSGLSRLFAEVLGEPIVPAFMNLLTALCLGRVSIATLGLDLIDQGVVKLRP